MKDAALFGMVLSCFIANFVFIQIKNPIVWIGTFIPYVIWILFLLQLAS